MKITRNEDGSLIIDGEGLELNENIEFEGFDFLKPGVLTIKNFIINTIKENDQLNYPMAE